MPRLPEDSPLLYPDNTGEYVVKDFHIVQDTCSPCLEEQATDEPGVIKEVIWRYVVGKHGCSESCNTVCLSHLLKEMKGGEIV